MLNVVQEAIVKTCLAVAAAEVSISLLGLLGVEEHSAVHVAHSFHIHALHFQCVEDAYTHLELFEWLGSDIVMRDSIERNGSWDDVEPELNRALGD